MNRETDPSTETVAPDEGSTAADRADEAAKPSDVGALDGAAAAGSPSAADTSTDGEGTFSTSAPDPTYGPD